MKQCICESPVIIRNPKLKELLISYRCYRTPMGDFYVDDLTAVRYHERFPKGEFSPKRMRVTHENIGDYLVYDDITGVCYPMFIEVPCGKCVICRESKSLSWQFRAVAESVTSKNNVYFVTLTYSDKYKPSKGVCKEALQLFMKRLRIRLERSGCTQNIKYFACGEYGTRSKRPHYHLILWNFPDDDKVHFPNITSILDFIERCWSVPMHDSKGKWLYSANDGKLMYEQLGFAMCKTCDSGAYSYVMKYMRKEKKAPEGMNEGFYLSSKGVGKAYCEKYESFYREHPEHLEISVFDPLRGEQLTCPLPKYYVDKYFPSLSKLIPKTIRDCYDHFLGLLHDRYACVRSLSCEDTLDVYPVLMPSEKQVIDMYHNLMYLDDFYLSCNIYAKRSTDSELIRQYYEHTFEIDSCVSVLLAAWQELDTELLSIIPELKRKRQESIDRWNENKPMIDIQARVDKLNRKIVKDSYREVL